MLDKNTDLTDQIRARVSALGFELADFRLGGSQGRPLLQVRIDRPEVTPGSGVTVDDCARVSRALEQWLDQAGITGPRYILEVSSPGIERPVRWREHWIKFVGRDVNVRLPGRGRVRATIIGVPEGADDVVLRLITTAEEIAVPLVQARDARLAVDWK
jgi:ribosome maturation factor RimP